MLEKGEVFDSSQLKDTVNSLIAEGKRNFAIDLSPLDYIYSDAINVILAINRRILDVSGRLSLMSPNPEVKSILERAGLHNILKIYETETDLLKSSEDIILQTTRFNLSDLKSYQEPKPKSEFEDFRSEISTAMSPEAPAQAAPSEPFGSFETEIQDDAFGAQQPKKRQPVPYMEEPYNPPAPPPPPPRQQTHPFEGPTAAAGQRREAMPHRGAPHPAPQPFPSDDSFDTQSVTREAPRAKPQYAQKPPERDFDRMEDEEEYDEEKPKNTLMPIIVGVIILAVLGVGGFIGYSLISKKPSVQETSKGAVQQVPKAMPELSQPAQPAPAQPAATVASAAVPAETPAAAAPEPVKTPPVEKKAAPKPASVQSKQTENGKKSSVAKISFTSRPTGASVTADGKVIGNTPCKYMDPPLGTILVVVSKQGYNDVTKTIEYTGGNKSENIPLTRLPKEAPASASPAPRQEPAAAPAADESAPAPAPARATAAEPAPAPEPPPAPAPAPAASAPASGGGDAATVFISSMPPVADVYMDGKLIGKTNISKLNVTAGSHSMRYVKGAVEVSEDMTFKPGDNPSHLVILKKQ
jgi:anti-anti-sigma factor